MRARIVKRSVIPGALGLLVALGLATGLGTADASAGLSQGDAGVSHDAGAGAAPRDAARPTRVASSRRRLPTRRRSRSESSGSSISAGIAVTLPPRGPQGRHGRPARHAARDGALRLRALRGPHAHRRVDFPMLGVPDGPDAGMRTAPRFEPKLRTRIGVLFRRPSAAPVSSCGTARVTCACRFRGRPRKAPRAHRPTRARPSSSVTSAEIAKSTWAVQAWRCPCVPRFLPRILGKNPPFVRPFCR